MRSRTSIRVALQGLFVAAALLAVGCSNSGGPGKGGMAAGESGQDQEGGEAAGGSGGRESQSPRSEGGQAGGETSPAGRSGATGGTSVSGGTPASGGKGGAVNAGGSAQTGGSATGGTAASFCTTLLCSDFEDGTITAPFRSSTSVAKVEPLTTELARKGSTKAFHIRLTKGSTGAVIRARNFKHTGSLHGRMYFYMSRSHQPLGHTYLFRAGGTPNVEFGGQFGDWLFAPAGEITRFTKPFPSQRWACIQWEANLGAKSISVSVDGILVGKATGKVSYPNFDTVDVGYFTYHPEDYEEPLDVWIDDVALDGAPIACN